VLSRGIDPPPERMLEQIVARKPVVTPSAVVAERASLEQVGAFDPAFSIAADWDLWIRLGAGGARRPLARAHVGYTNHPDNMHNDTAGILRERKALARKHESLLRGLHMGLGDELFWQWIASAQAPGRQRRLGARLYPPSPARPRARAADRRWLARLAPAPLLEDTLVRSSGARARLARGGGEARLDDDQAPAASGRTQGRAPCASTAQTSARPRRQGPIAPRAARRPPQPRGARLPAPRPAAGRPARAPAAGRRRRGRSPAPGAATGRDPGAPAFPAHPASRRPCRRRS
jgi:hypothetical protein